MAVTSAELAGFVSDTDPAGGEYVKKCLTRAAALVAGHIGAVETVPEAIQDACVLEVAADLYHRKTTRNGVASFGEMDLTPFRVSRDPMASAYPMLDNYVVRGIG